MRINGMKLGVWLYTTKLAIRVRRFINKHLMKSLLPKILSKKVTIVKNSFKPNGKSTIYLANHGFYEDIMAVISSFDDNVTLLIGVEGKANTPTFIEKFALWLNGYIQISRAIKESKNEGFDILLRILRNGGNLLIFPEAIWNLSPNLLMLGLHWGFLRMAEETDSNIVCAAIDTVNDGYSVIISENFHHSPYSDRQKAITKVRDIMATSVWDLMALKGVTNRKELSDEYWVSHIKKELSGFPNKCWHTEESYAFRPKDEVNLSEVLANLYGIEHRSMAASYEQYLKIDQFVSLWNENKKVHVELS